MRFLVLVEGMGSNPISDKIFFSLSTHSQEEGILCLFTNGKLYMYLLAQVGI